MNVTHIFLRYAAERRPFTRLKKINHSCPDVPIAFCMVGLVASHNVTCTIKQNSNISLLDKNRMHVGARAVCDGRFESFADELQRLLFVVPVLSA